MTVVKILLRFSTLSAFRERGKGMKEKRNINEYDKLTILDGLELLNAKSHTIDFPFHTHDTFNVALILDNTFNVKLNNKILKAPRGTLSITNPHEVHATPCDSELGNSFFTYYVSPDAIRKFNNGNHVFFEDKTIYDQKLFDEFIALSLIHKRIPKDFEDRLVKALKTLVRKYSACKPVTYQTNRIFQSFINETDFESFSLEKTASSFGINKYKFIRLFKQETGLTPNNFAILQKVNRSKEMLKTGKPIFHVAIDCGFYDNSHFYRNFKRFTGVNPLDFQKALLIN